MELPRINLPYVRPASLSDPCNDYSEEALTSLLAKTDEELGWHDFQTLLGPHITAGTYEESAYFLPLAFSFILTCEDNAVDLADSLVWFSSQYAPQLRLDGAIDSVREHLKYSLECWTRDFKILKHDSLTSIVCYQSVVMETTKCLIKYNSHQDLAVAFFTELAAAKSNPIKSAWFLESARACFLKEFDRPSNIPQIRKLFVDQTLLTRHARTVRESLEDFQNYFPYWLGTFSLLRLAVEI